MSGPYVGLMSGTSMDGIDAVVASFDDHSVSVHATHSEPYPADLREALLVAIREPLDVTLDESGELDRQVGECFRKAALAVVAASGIDRQDILAIGSHGQTLRHQPDADEPFSLQIGDADIIATGTSINTVANFREADIAAGGQGAPLVPPFHQWLFASPLKDRVVVNIGGVANVTILGSDGADTVGFDTGPGNGLMDVWTSECRGESFDRNGDWAASGSVVDDLLQQFLDDSYFSRLPPKSTGFEYFNRRWLGRFDISRFDEADIQATLSELSAITIADAVRTHAPAARNVFVCGGGVHNTNLMRLLQCKLPDARVSSTATVGLDPDWVEAVAFAWLAMQTLNNEPGNLPSVTGATHKVVLGDIHSP